MKNLKELRKKHNLTQYRLAAKLGVSDTTIIKWEQHVTNPTDKDKKKLIALFGDDVEFDDE